MNHLIQEVEQIGHMLEKDVSDAGNDIKLLGLKSISDTPMSIYNILYHFSGDMKTRLHKFKDKINLEIAPRLLDSYYTKDL